MCYTAFMNESNPNINPVDYFISAESPLHKQFIAMYMFFVEGYPAEQVAEECGYATSTIYSIARDFKERLASGTEDPFFKDSKIGRNKIDHGEEINQLIITYRKKNLSVPEIKSALDALNFNVSERYINALLSNEGFKRLPRRANKVRNNISLEDKTEGCSALRSERISLKPEKFTSQLAGILLFLPIIKSYGIDRLIENSTYPKTSVINRLSSILSFLALKLSDIQRYSMDDAWCMDKGMGMFAGLNVLPKTAWFSSYSSSVTREMNLSFLRDLRALWNKEGLLSDTVNLDFSAIPYWGDDDPFENNWSGKRTKALASIQAVLAQDPDSGLLCYGDTTIRHHNESDVVLEFLDFYHDDPNITSNLKYLVFDSKFTTYENLHKLNKKGLRFVTIQRKNKSLNEKIAAMPDSSWKDIRIMRSNGKGRIVRVCESNADLTGYEGEIRQVFIARSGKTKPAVLITNDFNIPLKDLVHKYSRRWLVEKGISEQIHFFHLNRNSSGIVIKVDFDLVVTILAHNLYRLLAQNMDGYSHCEARTIFNKFILNAGEISVSVNEVVVKLKRKRTLPLILDWLAYYESFSYQWIYGVPLRFYAANFT